MKTLTVFLLMTWSDTGFTVSPHLTLSPEQCQILIEVERAKGRPNVAAFCMPAGATLQLDTDNSSELKAGS